MNATIVFESKIYEYKGNYYKVLGVGKMKHPGTREWHIAVKYRKVIIKDDKVYGPDKKSPEYFREYYDFIKKFNAN